MKKNRVIILNGKNDGTRLPQLFNIFVAFASIDQQTVPEKFTQFREGKDIYYDVSNDKVEALLDRLRRDGFEYRIELLD